MTFRQNFFKILGIRTFKTISKKKYETEWNYGAIADFLLLPYKMIIGKLI